MLSYHLEVPRHRAARKIDGLQLDSAPFSFLKRVHADKVDAAHVFMRRFCGGLAFIRIGFGLRFCGFGQTGFNRSVSGNDTLKKWYFLCDQRRVAV